MGSKADMISSKFDEVSRIQIWREHLEKEQKLQEFNETFHLNPHTLVTVAGKPTEAVEEEDGDENDFAQLKDMLNSTLKPPQEKSDDLNLPMTAAQEVGWYHKDTSNFTTSSKPRVSSEETKYAAAYAAMAGTGPYNNSALKKN